MSPLSVLSRFVDTEPVRGQPQSVCELCAASVPEHHPHVVDLSSRTLCCSCQACSILFKRDGAGAGRYRTVPDRVLADPDRRLSVSRWSAAEIPVQLAFVFFNSGAKRWVAIFPSPAGPTEAELRADAFDPLRLELPLFSEVEPDVEAILVRRRRGQPDLDYFLVPIDVCYQLIARVRTLWRGFSGGDEAREAIDEMFADLRRRSRPIEHGGDSR